MQLESRLAPTGASLLCMSNLLLSCHVSWAESFLTEWTGCIWRSPSKLTGTLQTNSVITRESRDLFTIANHHANDSCCHTFRTAILIILFSQYLRFVPVPCPAYSKVKKLHTSKLFIFQMMPVCPSESNHSHSGLHYSILNYWWQRKLFKSYLSCCRITWKH